MAKDNTTEVLWDTSKAIDNIEKLVNSVNKASVESERSFDAMTSASENVEKALGKVSPRASIVLTEIKNLSAAFGATGVAGGAVAAVVGALATQLFDLPSLTRDTVAGLEALNEGLERSLELRNLISSVGDAKVNRQFVDEQINIDAKRAALARKEFDLRTERAGIQEKLDAQKGYYQQLDALAKASAKTSEDLQTRLSRLVTEKLANQGSNTTLPRQILDLLAQSQSASGAGDFDRAEKLLDKAKQLRSQTGDQSSFFDTRISSAEDQLLRSVQDRVKARNQETSAITRQRDALKSQIDAEEARKKKIEQKENRISVDRVTLEARSTENRLSQQSAKFEQDAQQATRERAAAHQQIVNILGQERSALEGIVDIGKLTLGVFTGISGPEAQKQIAEVKKLSDDIVKASEGLSNRTTQDDVASAKLLQDALDRYNDLQRRFEEGTISGALGRDLEKFKGIFDRFGDVLKADASLESAGRTEFKAKDEEGLFQAGKDNVSQAKRDAQELAGFLSQAAEASARINPQIPGVPTQSAAIGGGQAATQPQQVASTTTINVNAEVKGGLIDPETTRVIVGLIQREIRKGTVS